MVTVLTKSHLEQVVQKWSFLSLSISKFSHALIQCGSDLGESKNRAI